MYNINCYQKKLGSAHHTVFSIDRILKITAITLLLIGVGISYQPVMAAEFQSLPSIRLQAEEFIAQHPYQSPYPPGFEVGHIDNRLKLKACPNALSIEFTNPNKLFGNTALNISCAGATAWKLLLPVRIDLYDDVLIAATPLHKGQIIDENKVSFQKKNISRLNNGYYARDDDFASLEVRRNLKRGTVLTPNNLRPRLMVKSGQQVTLILEYKGLEIKSTGQALSSARRGEAVKVRNNQSRRVVEGIASGQALVRVNI
ncbi:MAG: flagellar basal body P-ring formation chaperone FlgA [Gammaproteobacteria bacterium]|nr:flagellar basal body P-ring formation chaperone FlgA [Gammaproteobacteria bacterium]